MKRAWKISETAHSHGRSCLSKTLIFTTPTLSIISKPSSLSHIRRCNNAAQQPPHSGTRLFDLIGLFTDQRTDSVDDYEDLSAKVAIFKDELVRNVDDYDAIYRVLGEKAPALFRGYSDGSCFIELMKQLRSLCPNLVLTVLKWRRAQADDCIPMTSEEYAKSIALAGRMKNIDLAVQLFEQAANKGMKRTSTYNALMGAYMYNNYSGKCRSLFQDLKNETNCYPTVVSYNILISVYGRLVMTHKMETVFKEMKDLDLSPNLGTYNNLIAGYVTAWMWDHMERTYMSMKAGSIKPDIKTHLLILRGYAHSGNLEKMEDIYELVRDHVNNHEIPLIRCMICSYCKSSATDKIKKIEALLALIPEKEYRPWLNVLLIKVYAQEDLIDIMENYINEAFDHKTYVITRHAMQAIVASYFRCNALEKLVNFVSRAESARWTICRSIYHSKMVLYASQNRFEEMENVLHEMEKFNLEFNKKSFWIMFKAYSSCGRTNKAKQVLGLMCKHGYRVPLDILHS